MTPRQIELARHALGLDEHAARKRSYRNRFYAGAGHADWSEWVTMVGMGLAGHSAKPSTAGWCFYLTLEGARAALRKGETLDREDFPEAAR